MINTLIDILSASTTMSYRHTRSTAAVTTTTTTPSNIGEGTIPEGVTNGVTLVLY